MLGSKSTSQRITRATRIFFCGLLLLMVSLTCSGEYDGSDPVYDTTRNPEGFPEPAVALLQDIETGRLRVYEAVTERFADLYTTNPSLLGDPAWSAVVDRLGIRLRRRADQMVRDGLLQYATAADLYLLAAQTRPADSILSIRSRLFGVWREVAADSNIDLAELTSDSRENAAIRQKLDFITGFSLRDRLHYQFAREFLVSAMFDRTTVDSLRQNVASSGLPAADQALLASFGLAPPPSANPEASFREPSVDLLAVRLTRVAMDSFRLETYFLPQERIRTDLGVTCWVETRDSLGMAGRQLRFPYDFRPIEPTLSWDSGKVAAGLTHFSFHYPISAVYIGLREDRDGEVAPVLLGDSSALHMIAIPSGSAEP